ncbi:hypothetical protein [Mesorhizobium sp. B1-1-8]|uniref:hypothetical protein n=1 Tax=Mesorhizobium sp. B1-1-8 TaxID=2589976 RepID=UPI00112E4D37|nr:hypothetical protein [Mesorhizobium sp. B1-1-8]UCI08691.1 hypothetical protein FJ974_06370 [Mesorhizobium sp. B1-1-8]
MAVREKQLSAFDLDALREAFKKSIREQEVTPIDWEECAKRFLQQTLNREPRGGKLFGSKH